MISLEEACLNLIAGEYGRFHSAYKISNDETLIRNFSFLFRHYTTRLISDMINLKDEYTDYLLNEYLVELDVHWFEKRHYGNYIKGIIRRLPRGNKLQLISLYNFCDDEVLEILADRCPNLEAIIASYSDVTDNGLEYLYKNADGQVSCPRLKKINIFSCSYVTDEGVKHLIQNLPSLERLGYEDVCQILYSLYEEDFHDIEKLPAYNLTHLEVIPDEDACTDLLKICLTLCPKLKSLECNVADEQELNLLNNTSLEKLDLKISHPDVKFDVNNFLKIRGRNLVSLKVENCIISVSNLAASCPKLRFLQLSKTDFLANSDHSQPAFHYLKKCNFFWTKDVKTTNKAVSFLLSFSPKLEYLRFHCCELSPEMKTLILKCCENNLLKGIWIHALTRDNEVKFVKDIVSSCLSLKTVILDFCYFSQLEEMEILEHAKIQPNTPYICIHYNHDARQPFMDDYH